MSTQIRFLLTWGVLTTAFAVGDEAVSVRSYDVTFTTATFLKSSASWMGCEYPAELGISPIVRYDRQRMKQDLRSGKLDATTVKAARSKHPAVYRLVFEDRFGINAPIWSNIIDSVKELKTKDNWSEVIVAIQSRHLSPLETRLLRSRMNAALTGFGEVMFLGDCLNLEILIEGEVRSLGKVCAPTQNDVWPFVRNIKQELGDLPPLLVSARSPFGVSIDRNVWEHPPEDLQVSIVLYEDHYVPDYGLSLPAGDPNRPNIDPQQFLNEYVQDKSETARPEGRPE